MALNKKPKRVGKFSIEHYLIDSDDPSMVHLMLANKVIVRAEVRYEMDAIEYHAYSDDFDEVEPGQQIPEYVAEFSRQQIAVPDDQSGGVKMISVFQRWVKRG